MDQTKEVLKTVFEAIEEKKGDRILILDISGVSSFTDYFVLCQGFNQRQNQAICDSVKERLKRELELAPSHIEGYEAAEWILMDYLNFVVHIFSPEAREFYKLERLWGDGVQLDEAALSA